MIARTILAILLLNGAAEARTFAYWIEPCPMAAGACHAGDPELAQWAMEAWQAASAGALKLERTNDRDKAQLRLYWGQDEPGHYGETRQIVVNGAPGAEIFVHPSVAADAPDELLRDAIVYLTCLHESGHALGLAHTSNFADIMYSFQYGGDFDEYFNRYRRKLSSRSDIHVNSGLSDNDRRRLVASPTR